MTISATGEYGLTEQSGSQSRTFDIGQGLLQALGPQPAPKRPLSATFTTDVRGPLIFSASWLSTVRRRIERSVETQADENISEGESIKPAIALTAIDFFDRMSDVLPGEPYLYCSTRGDLVAEFCTEKGGLTTIIGNGYALIYHEAGGHLNEGEIRLGRENFAHAREAVREISQKLATVKHGYVGSKSR